MDNKVRENRLRRMAKRQGLAVSKSRVRDPRALDFGRYYVTDLDNRIIHGGGNQWLDLDDIEAYLTSDRPRTKGGKRQ